MEDPASNLDTRGRQSGKRKASFSPRRPAPKIPRVVAYVDSSSGDEDTGVRVENRLFPTPLEIMLRLRLETLVALSPKLKHLPLCPMLVLVARGCRASLVIPPPVNVESHVLGLCLDLRGLFESL